MSAARIYEETRCVAAPSVRTCNLEGELVLLDIARGEYFGLGELGTLAWEGLSHGRSPAEVADELAPSYEVERATLLNDLVIFVRELTGAGLLVAETP